MKRILTFYVHLKLNLRLKLMQTCALMGSKVVLILGPPCGTNFGGQRVETWSRAKGPAVTNKGGRASQLALASRQRRASASAGDSECGAAV